MHASYLNDKNTTLLILTTSYKRKNPKYQENPKIKTGPVPS
jgi:hypothetical protein